MTPAEVEAELRSVAEEMRAVAAKMPEGQRYPISMWADRISPREPEPLKVGDRVRLLPHGQINWTTVHIIGDEAWIKSECGAGMVERLSNLQSGWPE